LPISLQYSHFVICGIWVCEHPEEPKTINALFASDTFGISMGKNGVLTCKGKNVAVFPSEDVCVVFSEVTMEGLTSVIKSKSGPEPPLRRMIKRYYEISTTAKHVPPIKIKIVFPCDLRRGTSLRLWRWYPKTKRWENITKSFRSKYNIVIGETGDPLESMFAVT
jgi:hypothetical protein